ncbi:hypothetical protein FVE85_2221 [Porphyridium purpureum]|uniref:Uncharacterized protein n=1 Tax=Porphyridium purpureum TaxID=35688 RepID=A0A5J4YXJ4_PORPP|nr:hypothetical protein FVE85_2221 [Porphyridium purpureum]|eukprot:POR6329..scf209_3
METGQVELRVFFGGRKDGFYAQDLVEQRGHSHFAVIKLDLVGVFLVAGTVAAFPVCKTQPELEEQDRYVVSENHCCTDVCPGSWVRDNEYDVPKPFYPDFQSEVVEALVDEDKWLILEDRLCSIRFSGDDWADQTSFGLVSVENREYAGMSDKPIIFSMEGAAEGVHSKQLCSSIYSGASGGSDGSIFTVHSDVPPFLSLPDGKGQASIGNANLQSNSEFCRSQETLPNTMVESFGWSRFLQALSAQPIKRSTVYQFNVGVCDCGEGKSSFSSALDMAADSITRCSLTPGAKHLMLTKESPFRPDSEFDRCKYGIENMNPQEPRATIYASPSYKQQDSTGSHGPSRLHNHRKWPEVGIVTFSYADKAPKCMTYNGIACTLELGLTTYTATLAVSDTFGRTSTANASVCVGEYWQNPSGAVDPVCHPVPNELYFECAEKPTPTPSPSPSPAPPALQFCCSPRDAGAVCSASGESSSESSGSDSEIWSDGKESEESASELESNNYPEADQMFATNKTLSEGPLSSPARHRHAYRDASTEVFIGDDAHGLCCPYLCHRHRLLPPSCDPTDTLHPSSSDSVTSSKSGSE